MSSLSIHRPRVRRVGARHVITGMGNERRLLALDVLKGVNNESMGISVLGDDDAESRDELFVNVQHDQTLQEGRSLLSAARALTLCGLSPEASGQGGAFVRPNTSARLTEIEGADQSTGPLGGPETV